MNYYLRRTTPRNHPNFREFSACIGSRMPTRTSRTVLMVPLASTMPLVTSLLAAAPEIDFYSLWSTKCRQIGFENRPKWRSESSSSRENHPNFGGFSACIGSRMPTRTSRTVLMIPLASTMPLVTSLLAAASGIVF